MDAPSHHHPRLNGVAAVDEAEQIPPDPSTSAADEGPKLRRKNKNKKKKQALISDSASSASSNNCSYTNSFSQKGFKVSRNPKRFRVGSRSADVGYLGLPLGMSIAAVVSKVLERKGAAATKMPVEFLSEMCVSAVRESLEHVFGHKFESFVTNFEQSFRSTLRTLRLISDSSQNVEEHLQRGGFKGNSSSTTTPICPSLDRTENSKFASASTNGLDRPHFTDEQVEANAPINLINQLVLRDKEIEQQLACVSTSQSPSDTSINQSSMLSTIEKSLMEQTRSNDLKAVEIGIKMKELLLQERQLALSSESNSLKRCNLSMGFSKASFRAEKFKTQLQNTREAELLKKCLDFLVAGLIIMLSSLFYGTYVYSHRRIIEVTEACSPYIESKSSWWMPKSMASFNSGWQSLRCQILAVSRMLSGIIMIGVITFLLFQRSGTSHHAMPVTFMLILGVACGVVGKFCIDTLGGSGNDWVIYWEVLCVLHFLSNFCHSALFVILYGPITVSEKVERSTVFPFWMRRSLFYAILLILPLLCGFMPFATPREWFDHFSSKTSDFFEVDD